MYHFHTASLLIMFIIIIIIIIIILVPERYDFPLKLILCQFLCVNRAQDSTF